VSRQDVYPRALEVHADLKKGRPVTLRTIEDRYEISGRHAYRVIEYLKDHLKAPVDYNRAKRCYYYTKPTFELPAVILTEGEAIGIILAHEALLRRQGTPLGRHLRRSIETLRGLLPASISVDHESLLNRVLFSPLPARHVPDEVLDAVTTVLERHHRLHIKYYAPTGDEVTERDIDVYHLADIRGDWYAVAWCHLRNDLRTFALSRMSNCRLLDKTYTIPSDFSVERYFQDSLGAHAGHQVSHVVLDFAPDSSRWARERRWHPTQEIEDREDGGVRLSLDVTLSMELVRWILSWGGHVRVVEPAALQEWVAREVRDMAALYR
jgi:predicted DNA-binding transcriptional regulator YafY